ncbi:MAG: DUF448 domain-containing protein [Firmicutes bacterium HGW-Firmicutes-21]|nr:MAG: DUF448 domain-containing protein [Firmicutes bacterium HGW-Firmicutes-21]
MIEKKRPARKCIGCGEMKEKISLLRIVRTKDSIVFIDPTGKKAGRGAYICKDVKCFDAAKKGHRIERAFETKIANEVYDQLREQLMSGMN